jgi:heme/copper-type cytochrome/quinol oxidase subunit 3
MHFIKVQRLSVTAGTIITLLMVTSSYFIACSVNAIRRDKHGAAVIWLLAGLIIAIGYPLTKALEIHWNLAHGINGESGIFSRSLLPHLHPPGARHLGHPRHPLGAGPTALAWLLG